MMRMQRMGASGPFNEVYVTELRSSGPLDMRRATDMVMHQLHEETYRHSAFRGRDTILVVIHNVDSSHGLMYATNRMCDGSCEVMREKTVFDNKQIQKQIDKTSELLLLT